PYADHIHLSDYRPVGEKAAQAYLWSEWARVGGAPPWQPLQPTRVTRTGLTVQIDFHVPFAPLAWDAVNVAPHGVGTIWAPWWIGAMGFEFYDGVQVIQSATNASPIVIGTTTPHGLTTGATVYTGGILGNGNANRLGTVTVVDSTHLSLDGTTGSGAF